MLTEDCYDSPMKLLDQLLELSLDRRQGVKGLLWPVSGRLDGVTGHPQ